MQVLVINCGSSSVKYQLLDPSTQNKSFAGKVESIGEHGSDFNTHTEALQEIFNKCRDHKFDAVGHRVVHGGERFVDAAVIDDAVLREIDERSVDAPLHNPFNLEGVRLAMQNWPDIPHVAVFDTAFHAQMPSRARSYGIDPLVADKHRIRRFGFHGSSHQYVAQRAAEKLDSSISELRIVSLHLGNGASACAIEYGKSVETSMGMTPVEGLIMGTRSGDIDAGAILSLLRSGEYTTSQLDELLNRQSGLLGLSGVSNDLRKIEDRAEEGDDRARLAINVFAHRARKYIGAYAATMGGVDAIVFTAGIGENSSTMRRRILQRLEFLGLRLDDDRNESIDEEAVATVISTDRSRVQALVVKTDEALMIAQQTQRVVDALKAAAPTRSIPVAVSARHVHLTRETFSRLFGADAEPTVYKEISQPGQFACNERVNLVGPRNRIDRVRVLGPLRSVDQVEIARTDEFRLGIDAPIRDSGKVAGSAAITLEGPKGTVHLSEGLICARRHIHMHPDDAAAFAVSDKDIVEVAVIGGPRDLAFGDVLVRVSEKYKLEMHIDTDEANAAEIEPGTGGELICDQAVSCGAMLRKSRG